MYHVQGLQKKELYAFSKGIWAHGLKGKIHI